MDDSEDIRVARPHWSLKFIEKFVREFKRQLKSQAHFFIFNLVEFKLKNIDIFPKKIDIEEYIKFSSEPITGINNYNSSYINMSLVFDVEDPGSKFVVNRTFEEIEAENLNDFRSSLLGD